MGFLGWLLSAAGLSGAGIGVAVLLGGGPALLGIGLKALAFAKSLSPKTWLYIGGAVALVVGVIWHRSTAHKKLRDTYTAGYNRRAAADAVVLAALRTRVQTAEANAAKISQEERTKNETDNRNIRTAADDLRVHGAGAASCRRIDYPAVSAASGGHGAASRPADAAVAQVPSGEELFGLPIDGAVSFAEDHDLDRAEVLSWRGWYGREAAELEKLRKKP